MKHSVRLLARRPGFSVVAILALALGTGANTAIFSFVRTALIDPLPYENADRLFIVWGRNDALGASGMGASGPNFIDWQERSTSFEELALLQPGSGTLTGLGEPEQVPGMRVTSNLLDILDAKMTLGRNFRPEEGLGSGDHLGIVSYGYWTARCGRDPGIVGRTYTVDGLSYKIIGVAGPNAWLPVASDFFAPWNEDDLRRMNRNSNDFGVIGLLKDGVTAEQAEGELNAIQRQILNEHPETTTAEVSVVPLSRAFTDVIRTPLLVLMAAVGFVLLIACANVANLLLSRAAVRQREVALRSAVGASRWALLRQFMAESITLGLAGGAAGLVFAHWAVGALKGIIPSAVNLPGASVEVMLAEIRLDGAVLLFTLLLSMATGLLFGIAPAIWALGGSLTSGLREGGRGHSSSRAAQRFRDGLVVAEISLALVLLTGAGLMLESFRKLSGVDPGFRTRDVLTLQMEMPTDSKYRSGAERGVFLRRVLEEMETVPGVTTAGLTQVLPLDARISQKLFQVEGQPLPPNGKGYLGDYTEVSPKYFEAFGIPLRSGRAFEDRDNRDAAPVAIVSESLARQWFTDRIPLGQRIILPERQKPLEIVGVVGDVRHAGLSKGPQPTIYVPYYQSSNPLVTLVVRTTSDPKSMARSMKEAVWRVDPDQPLFRIRTMEEVVAQSRVTARLTLVLLGIFAGFAVVLASIGIYGVMSFSVSQRRQEIGVRLAVGAARGDVFRLVLGRSAALAGIGVAGGILLGAALARLIEGLLYGVTATDPMVYATVAATLFAVATAASYPAARRAARVDPVVTLRYE